MRSRPALVVACGVLLVAGAAFGVLGAFYHLVSVGVVGVQVPVLLPLLAGLLGVLALTGARVCGGRVGAVLPASAWLVVTLILADPRPEGDVVVTGSASSLAYLLVCTVVAGVAVGAAGSRGGVGRVEK